MELILNMKNPKNKESQEKIEQQLNILKQCFENRLNELRKENKILRERAKELSDERICSICLENKLNR
jgi:chaperonin cofactor prefoldin